MTNPTPLSLATQAVQDAFWLAVKPEPHHQHEAVAAALRAAVDQVITGNRLSALEEESHAEARLLLIWTRDQFLAIARELEEER